MKVFLTTTRKIFYSPTRGNFESKCFVPVCQFKLKHFLLNWHFSCKCHFNAIFKLKWQFGNETVWYESIFVSKCQNVILLKTSLQFQIWSGRTFCFALYTHTHAHSAHLQHVMLFIPAGWKHNPKILENWDAVNDILQLLKMSNTNKTQIFFPVKVGLREWKVHLLSSVKPQIRHSFSFPVSKWSQRHFSSK